MLTVLLLLRHSALCLCRVHRSLYAVTVTPCSVDQVHAVLQESQPTSDFLEGRQDPLILAYFLSLASCRHF